MARYVNVASVQFATKSERDAPDAAKIVLEETRGVLESLKGYGLDLVVFCEGVEAHGLTIETAEEADNPGPFLQTYGEFAVAEGCHVAGSAKIREGDAVYNSIAFIDPAGKVLGAYHKVNLTIGEIDDGLRSGSHAVVVDTAIGRIGGAICFDLNFEGVRHEYRALKPDIITFASMYHGGLMQQMWAYECRSFFVSSLPFHGCGVLDPFGRPLKLTDCYSPVARATINLDRAMVHLDYNREKFADLEKKYLGEVVVDIPPNIGPALIYSLTDRVTAMDVVKEFGLELIDDYFARSRERNARNRGGTTQ